jgi:hypothetical protein
MGSKGKRRTVKGVSFQLWPVDPKIVMGFGADGLVCGVHPDSEAGKELKRIIDPNIDYTITLTEERYVYRGP